MGETSGTIGLEQKGDVSVVSLVGDHDVCTADAVAEELERCASSGRGLVVSLMPTTFFDSAIVHSLFTANTLLKAHRRRLVLHVATATIVHRVLTISGLAQEVPCTVRLRRLSN